MAPRAQPEAQLQKAIIGHLQWRAVPDCFWFHPPNGGWRSRIEGAIFKSLGVKAGAPDLFLVCGGQCFCLELKAPAGRLTAAQAQCHEQLKRAGARVSVVHDIDAALAQLEEWQLLHPSTSTEIAQAFNQLRRDVAARRAVRHSSQQRDR
jgi:hypothetical protein